MESNTAAVYSYKLDNRLNVLIAAAVISGFLAVMLGSAFAPWGFFLLLAPLGIVIHIKRSGISKPLVVASRYLILGDQIVYYRSVTRVHLDKGRQTLTISPSKGKPLVISADKFPTSARKIDKIKANQAVKFGKVSGKIIERLNAVVPEAVST